MQDDDHRAPRSRPLSFFDEGDPPGARPARAARTARPAAPSAGARTAARTYDPETLRRRRLVAAGVGLVLFVLLVLLVRSCLHGRAEDRLRAYNRSVADLVTASDREVSRPLFDRLRQGGGSPVALETDVNQLTLVAHRQLEQAQGLDAPAELRPAQRNLLLALDLRETGLRKVASRVRAAFGRGEGASSRAAITAIAAQMQGFLASDVIYDQRVRPFLADRLRSAGLSGERPGDGQFLPSLAWLSPDAVAGRLGRPVGSTSSGGAARTPAPGRHGHGLTGVSVGGTTLQPGNAINRITVSGPIAFTVSFANQGNNDERDVPVRVRISGGGTGTISATRRVPTTTAGQTAQAQVPLSGAPPLGQPVQVQVTIGKVGGEQLTDNNTQTYTVIFGR